VLQQTKLPGFAKNVLWSLRFGPLIHKTFFQRIPGQLVAVFNDFTMPSKSLSSVTGEANDFSRLNTALSKFSAFVRFIMNHVSTIFCPFSKSAPQTLFPQAKAARLP
jgi:hypothetical protein